MSCSEIWDRGQTTSYLQASSVIHAGESEHMLHLGLSAGKTGNKDQMCCYRQCPDPSYDERKRSNMTAGTILARVAYLE